MRDFIVSIVFLFMSVFTFITSEKFTKRGKNEFSLAYNPAMYPRILAAILLILSLVLLIQAIRKGAFKNIKIKIDREKSKKSLMLFLLIVAYVAGIHFTGYIISTAVCIFLFILLFDGKILQAILSSVGATIALYLIFRIAFKILLPTGYFFE